MFTQSLALALQERNRSFNSPYLILTCLHGFFQMSAQFSIFHRQTKFFLARILGNWNPQRPRNELWEKEIVLSELSQPTLKKFPMASKKSCWYLVWKRFLKLLHDKSRLAASYIFTSSQGIQEKCIHLLTFWPSVFPSLKVKYYPIKVL